MVNHKDMCQGLLPNIQPKFLMNLQHKVGSLPREPTQPEKYHSPFIQHAARVESTNLVNNPVVKAETFKKVLVAD